MSRRNVSYVTQEDPEFIKNFKLKVGYKEEKDDIQNKFMKDDSTELDKPLKRKARAKLDSDDEEFKPQVVVLEDSGLTCKEIEECKSLAEDEDNTGRRIIFRKPKRKAEDKDPIKSSKLKELEKSKEKTKDSKSKVGVKKNLLSFDVDE